jgi:pimeloyl-ACP methyl ester carboxylesterase
MAALPKTIEMRRKVRALHAANPQLAAAERAYSGAVWEKVRSGALQVPVLIYDGKQDVWDWDVGAPHAMHAGSMNLFDLLGAANPRVKFMLINMAGHFVQREQPDQFSADLIHFIEFWNSNTSSSRGR